MVPQEIRESYLVDSPEQAMALLNPLRAEILSQMQEPASATEIAKNINETPQRVNYHLKALEKVGLVHRVGSRQIRNLVEVLYQSIARTFVLAESLGWNEEIVQKMKDQSSLTHLVTISERMKKDVLLLMQQVDENEIIPSATLQLEVQLQNEEERKSFVEEYVQMVKKLVHKYQLPQGEGNTYNVTLAVYPQPLEGGNEHE